MTVTSSLRNATLSVGLLDTSHFLSAELKIGARRGNRRGCIRNTWSSHCSLHNFILLQSVSLPFSPTTHFRTSTLLTLSPHPTLTSCRKQWWSNTSGGYTSSWQSGHVSHSYSKMKPMIALYAWSFMGKWNINSVQQMQQISPLNLDLSIFIHRGYCAKSSRIG